MVIGDNMKKLIYLFLFLTIFTFGCSKKDLTNGKIENIKYTETEEVTNYVKMVTNKDKVVIMELYPDIAPETVANFQKLVKEKFYDGLIFHRVIADFMVQTGDPLGNGTGGSEDSIKGEFAQNGFENNLKHEEGILSMARQEKDFDSASSQFFICVNDNDSIGYLDGAYAAFGKVIAGYKNILEISKVRIDDYDKPIVTQSIKTMRFVNVEK